MTEKLRIQAWFVEPDALVESTASLYRPETKNGDPRIWLSGLPKYSTAGNVLALFAHGGDIYVANVSSPRVWESASNPSTPLGQLLDKISGAKNRPIADKFSAWNLRLLRSFFSEASKGEEVFLRIDKDALDEVGQDLGGDAGFLEAVRMGPSWRQPNSSLVIRIGTLIEQRNLIARLKPSDYENPKKLAAMLKLAGYIDPGDFDATYRGCAAPAYLPYLAMLVRIAASSTVDGFYKQLQGTLGLREPFGSNQMATVENAWVDLERWTKAHAGRFGRFKLRRLGGYQHIGVPQSQSILKPGDVQRIPLLFDRAEIRPDRDLSDELIGRILREARSESARAGTFLSKSFCGALGKPEFELPVTSILRAIYEDWDGTLPAKRSSADATQGSGNTNHGITLCLSVAQEDPLEFDVHWRLPAIYDSGSFELTRGEASWGGTYMGADEATTRAVSGFDHALWNIAEESFGGDIQFHLKSKPGDDVEEIREHVVLEKRLLWVLVPSFDGPDGRAWLREDELPAYGTAFLLAPPENVARLKDYLGRETPNHAVIEAVGLPSDWMLIRLNECSDLTDNQRTLPDGAEPHRVPRLIRFVGGRSVRRGYGHMYLPYDLPSVELDAPARSTLAWSDGLDVTEEGTRGAEEANPSALFRPVRRFKLRLRNSGNASYKFEALLDGEVIGRSATLRISGTDGDLVEVGQQFSLDSLGRPQSSLEGLSGVVPDYAMPDSEGDETDCASVTGHDLGETEDGHSLSLGVEEKFLDALARGAMDAGVARKLIERLLVDAGREDNPTFILMALRSRGHIEVATTQKGHMSRVHIVQPTIFQLPAKVSGRSVYGVLGTLRFAHWEALFEGNPGWHACSVQNGSSQFIARRLVEQTQGAIESACSPNGPLGIRGFCYAKFPSRAIAQWSENLNVVRETALLNSIESIGKAAEGARRFNAAKGTWFPITSQVLPHELWKAKNLETGLGDVHYLVNREECTNKLQHAFVRDSRWGVWITLEAFARFLREKHGRDDVHPFPITYDQVENTVWLPARIGVPVALERSLVLCSAASPEEWTLTNGGASDDGRLILSPMAGGTPKVRVSPVYHDMAKGKWLAYRWVPKSVAALVADRLGARLDVV